MTIFEVGFIFPQRLWALVAVPVLLLLYLVWNGLRRSRTKTARTGLEVLFPKRRAWKRHVAVIAAVASLASLTIAWAAPAGYVNVPRDRATVFLVIDISLSMRATDVPPDRLKAAQTAAKEFINDIPDGFNVSLISFAAAATMLVPPTPNRPQVETAIDSLTLRQSTAIGEGIYSALDGLSLIPDDPFHPNDPAPAVIVLLSDGESNTGRSSTSAAQDAKALEVPIFTIAFGTANGYIIDDRGASNPVPVNKEELRNIAAISGGKAYSADSLGQLREVYSGISRTIGYEKEETEITERFVGFAVVFGVIALLGVMSLAARWP